MNEFKDFLSEIGIKEEGRLTDDDEYIIEFDDPDKQSKIFSLLEKSDKVGLDEERQEVDFDSYKFKNLYKSSKYEIQLDSDFDDDIYTLTIRKRIED